VSYRKSKDWYFDPHNGKQRFKIDGNRKHGFGYPYESAADLRKRLDAAETKTRADQMAAAGRGYLDASDIDDLDLDSLPAGDDDE
jgi:hypothetical protein